MPYSPQAVANYFLERSLDEGKPLTPMQVLKLVYLAHGWHLALKDTPLLNEAVQAWQYGPVIESLYQDLKRYGRDPVTRLVPVAHAGDRVGDEDVEEQLLLDRIWEVYSVFDGLQLSAMTHQEESPWHQVWHDPALRGRRVKLIPNQVIKADFQKQRDASRRRGSDTTA